jgi:protocatechuate 3,4-dioxygenase, alpha subunit
MIVDLTPTPSQTVGPFFHLGCTNTNCIHRIAGPNAKGEHVRLSIRAIDGEGLAVDDAMIEIWQADAAGKYNVGENKLADAAEADFGGFGRSATDENGLCVFETIKPGRVPDDTGKLQAPHLNVSVFARGVMKRLVTRIYFSDDPANHECPILALVPEDRRCTLMAHRGSRVADSNAVKEWRFDVHLCGKDETVFFDV